MRAKLLVFKYLKVNGNNNTTYSQEKKEIDKFRIAIHFHSLSL